MRDTATFVVRPLAPTGAAQTYCTVRTASTTFVRIVYPSARFATRRFATGVGSEAAQRAQRAARMLMCAKPANHILHVGAVTSRFVQHIVGGTTAAIAAFATPAATEPTAMRATRITAAHVENSVGVSRSAAAAARKFARSALRQRSGCATSVAGTFVTHACCTTELNCVVCNDIECR
jgi:hypothetical protein